MTGDKLTVTISGVDDQGKAITRTVEIPVKDEPVFSDPDAHAAGAQTGERQAARHLRWRMANAGDGAHHHHDGERCKTVGAVYAGRP